MNQPSIFPFGIRIDEPVTTLTDVLVAAVCFYAFFKLRKVSDGSLLHKLVLWYFALMGGATLIGGIIGHAFLYALSFNWKLPGWLLSMLAINLLERVMIRFSKPVLSTNRARFFSYFNIAELVAFAALAFGYLNFRFVEIHSVYGLLVVVFGFCVFNYRKNHGREVVRQFMIATGFAFIAAVIFVAKWDIDQWFRHVDMAHVFMAISAWFFYVGSQKLMSHTAYNPKYQ